MSTTELYGQLQIIDCGSPAWANGQTLVRVGIGSDWFTEQGVNYKHAAACLRVKLAYLFTYSDAIKRGSCYMQAEELAIEAKLRAIEKEKDFTELDFN